MKKLIGILIVSLILVFSSMFSQAIGELTPGDENVIFYRNFENVYDANGMYVESGTRELVVGDHLFGIINAQNINVGGTTTWFQSATDQITGIFAQRIEAIFLPDTYDLTGGQTLPHIVLGPPTITLFCKMGDCVSTMGFLGPGEMFAFFRQTSAGTTPFEYNGTIADDVAKATDGALWLTLGYSAGMDSTYGTADDDGYFYSHVSLGAPLINFTGETWGQLDAIQNNTGYLFAGINDPNELEIDLLISGFSGGLLNDIHLSSELELNPDSVLLGGNSPWDIRSNDPASMYPVESYCGDGIVDPPDETCDPPGLNAGQPNECRADCTFCGDNILDLGEYCDDGNNVDGDGCSAICTVEQEDEGCTPGWWRQRHHLDSWPAPYMTGTLFSNIFEDAFPGKTLLQVLRQGGGGLKVLGRHTVAALLNSASPDVSYDLSIIEVIDMFNDVYPGSKQDYNSVKNTLENFNEQVCPLR